jgi:hypothetical protein
VGPGPAAPGGPARPPRVEQVEQASAAQAEQFPGTREADPEEDEHERRGVRLRHQAVAGGEGRRGLVAVEAGDHQEQERLPVAQLLPPSGPPQPDRETSRAGQAYQPEYQAGGGNVVARPQREQRDPQRVNQGGERGGGDGLLLDRGMLTRQPFRRDRQGDEQQAGEGARRTGAAKEEVVVRTTSWLSCPPRARQARPPRAARPRLLRPSAGGYASHRRRRRVSSRAG